MQLVTYKIEICYSGKLVCRMHEKFFGLEDVVTWAKKILQEKPVEGKTWDISILRYANGYYSYRGIVWLDGATGTITWEPSPTNEKK